MRWEFYTHGKENVSYQRHALMGSTQVADPKLSQDIDLLVAAYGHRLISGKERSEEFFPVHPPDHRRMGIAQMAPR